MKKLKIPENLTTLAYRSIKDFILDHELEEDARLTEEALSQELGISKSPVREALNRLEAEGLITIEPRRGAYLRNFSKEEINDLYCVREALEVYAVGQAVVSPAMIEQLEETLRKQREFLDWGNRARYIEEDVRFHALIAESTGNAYLLNLLENLQNKIFLIRRKTYDLSSSDATALHRGIVEALASGDQATAQERMKEHISLVRTRLLKHLGARRGKADAASR